MKPFCLKCQSMLMTPSSSDAPNALKSEGLRSIIVRVSNWVRYTANTELTQIAATTSRAGITYEAEGVLSVLLVDDLNKLQGESRSKVGVLGNEVSFTCSQFPPPPNRDDGIATMWSLSTLNLPHAPRPTLKNVPY